jgi:hypothetical protein
MGSGRRSLPRPALAVAALAAAALVLWLAYGRGYVGYDTLFALRWGEDLAFGRTPEYVGPHGPTPHPLANLLGVVLGPLGSVAVLDATVLIWLVLTACMAGAAYALGRELFSVPVGVLFALILVTRPHVTELHLQSSVDVPFLAAVLAAATLEARRTRAGAPVLVLLAAAGLLRPEAWALSLAYLAWLLPGLTGSERLKAAALAVSAPVLWALADLAITGDPFFSLNRTQGLATRLGRPQGLGTAIELTPPYIERVLGEPMAWVGLAGVALGVMLAFERVVLPLALLVLGLAGFLVLGALDLPVLQRYLFLPAAMLAFFAAVALAGWTVMPRGRVRASCAIVAAVLAIAIAVDVSDTASEIERAKTVLNGRSDAQRTLHELGGTAEVLAALERCPSSVTPVYPLAPSLALLSNREPDAVFTNPAGPGRRGLFVVPARQDVAQVFRAIGAHAPVVRDDLPRLARNDDWIFYARCAGVSAAASAP